MPSLMVPTRFSSLLRPAAWVAIILFTAASGMARDSKPLSNKLSKLSALRGETIWNNTFIEHSGGSQSPDWKSTNGILKSTPEESNYVKLDFIPLPERAARTEFGCGRIESPKGTYGVEGHGLPDTMFYRTGERCSAVDLAEWIKSDPRYTKGMPIWLFVCESGKGDNPFAQSLADLMGVPVTAPTDKMWLDRGNGYAVCGEQPQKKFLGMTLNGKRRDTSKPGMMKEFLPAKLQKRTAPHAASTLAANSSQSDR